MIKAWLFKLRQWLREWLGIDDNIAALLAEMHRTAGDTCNRFDSLQQEIAQLRIERYVPPATPEPERKIIKTRNWREFTQLIEQEQEAEEARNAV